MLRRRITLLLGAILLCGVVAIFRPVRADSVTATFHPEKIDVLAGSTRGDVSALHTRDVAPSTPEGQAGADEVVRFQPTPEGHQSRLDIAVPSAISDLARTSIRLDLGYLITPGSDWQLLLFNRCIDDWTMAARLVPPRSGWAFDQYRVARPACYLSGDRISIRLDGDPTGPGVLDYLAVAIETNTADDGPASADPGAWWQPGPGVSWQWQETTPVNTDLEVDMYGIDLFAATSSEIHQLQTDGRVVICSYDATTVLPSDPDASAFPARSVDRKGRIDLHRWRELQGPLRGRIERAAAVGCDGIAPKGADAHLRDARFGVTEQLSFNTWTARSAHRLGLSIGLREALGQVPALVNHYDWALSIQCSNIRECAALSPFIDNDKAVLGLSFGEHRDGCGTGAALGIDWIRKNDSLDAWRRSCDI